jgi:hypothetical protein
MEQRALLPEGRPIALITHDDERRHADLAVVATRDHELIRRWADRRHAEPATGEATESGPSTIVVNDEDAGVRFNFPAAGRFRPIDWDEWFRHFETYSLVFVYERDEAARTPSSRYRLVPLDVLRQVARVV